METEKSLLEEKDALKVNSQTLSAQLVGGGGEEKYRKKSEIRNVFFHCTSVLKQILVLLLQS